MRVLELLKSIDVPENVNVRVEGRVITVKGEKGTLTRNFSHAPLLIQLKERVIRLGVNWPRKKEAALLGTVYSHINNMITGVTKGFTYRLKIVYSHFPIAVNVKGRNVFIENFTGERRPRTSKIRGDSEVKVKDEDVIVQGINIEDVSQTAANIQQATKIKRKDARVFLDGIYVYERTEGMEG